MPDFLSSAIFAPYPLENELAHRLNAMPKIELHVHLEGAVEAATVWEMAQRNGLPLPAASLAEWRTFFEFRDFSHFLEVYTASVHCMQTPQNFAMMTERFLEKQAAMNVRYTEAFLSASFFVCSLPLDELIDALQVGADAGEAKYGSRVRFIPDISRHEPESARPVLDFVLKGWQRGLFLGLGLGGPEQGYPPGLYEEVYAEARRQGLHVVAHAGETAGPESIWGALQELQVERIGHGVKAVDDPVLMDTLRDNCIPLEVSPVSNYRLKVVLPDRPHPIRELVDHGLLVTVNSDDPSMFATDLNGEYQLLARQGFRWHELWQLNLNAIEASFLPDEEKKAYRAEWASFSKDF
jgi:adenosine deaminase